MMQKTFRAFTLIELLIVVAIIAILAAIAVPNFLEAQVRSKVSRAKADMRSVTTALEAYRVDNPRYPPSCATKDQDGPLAQNLCGTQAPGGITGTTTNVRVERLAWITTPIAYISTIPADPFAVGANEGGTGAAREANIQNPVFTYWDPGFISLRTTSSQNEVIFEDMPEMIDNIGSWLLFSYGPDQTFFPAANFPLMRQYDPTNGTVSAGDIIRWSGGQVE